MIYHDNMMNTKNVFSQLFRFMLCMILLLAALPFIGLAAIFSIFTDLPHIKIELGEGNIVESVAFRLKRDIQYESENEEDEDSEDSGEDADDEMEVDLPGSPKPIGRVGGFEDNYPATPVRNTSPVCIDAPRKPRSRSAADINSPITPPRLDMAQLNSLMAEQFDLDTGILTKLRATTELNDRDITPIPCESFSGEDGGQTPSECPPSS